METKAEVWIPLTQGKVAVVDFEDFEKIRGIKWHATQKRNRFYVARARSRKLGNPRISYLHREIMLPGRGLEVDHIDGDGLNNRRANLRVVTHSQNIIGWRQPKAGGSSIFRGVFWDSTREKWVAKISVGGKDKHVGVFVSESAAAQARDAAAIKYFGEFALLNFPDQNQKCQSLISNGGAA